MKVTVWPRIEAVLKYTNMSANAFANHIGLPHGENLYQIKRGNNGISIDLANRIIAKFPQINMLWLMTGKEQMILGDAPIGPWSQFGAPNSEAFRGWAATQILPKLLEKNCPDPYGLAVEHAEKLQAALAKKKVSCQKQSAN